MCTVYYVCTVYCMGTESLRSQQHRCKHSTQLSPVPAMYIEGPLHQVMQLPRHNNNNTASLLLPSTSDNSSNNSPGLTFCTSDH